jgi:hypothetical protein
MTYRASRIALALLLPACRLLVSTDGLQGGAAANDAAPPPVIDASLVVEASSTDAGVIQDVMVEAAPVPFCQTKPGALFCTDFDLTGRDEGKETANLGTFTIDALHFVSAPKSALFTTPLGNAKDYRDIEHVIPLPGAALKEITLEFSVRPETKPEPNTNVALTYLFMKSNGQETRCGWDYRETGLRIYVYNKPDNTGNNETYYFKDFPAGINEWHTVKSVLTFGDPANGGAGGKFVATVDGTTQSESGATVSNVGDNFSYGLAIYGSEAFAAAKQRFDNVALSVKQ